VHESSLPKNGGGIENVEQHSESELK